MEAEEGTANEEDRVAKLTQRNQDAKQKIQSPEPSDRWLLYGSFLSESQNKHQSHSITGGAL